MDSEDRTAEAEAAMRRGVQILRSELEAMVRERERETAGVS